MECLGLHNKPTAEVHPGHMLTGPKEEEKEKKSLLLPSIELRIFQAVAWLLY
jgi:hypothetical protein